jgi:alanine racemase
MDPIDISSWPLIEKWAKNPMIVDQVVIDSRQITTKNALFVALKGRRVDGHEFIDDAFDRGAKYCIVGENTTYKSSKGILIKVESPLRAMQNLAHFYRKRKKAFMIAITGSRGKTMCKDLLHHFLKQSSTVYATKESFNSQIGVALSLLEIKDDHEIAIIEAGVSKKGEMHHLAQIIEPDLTILTSLKESASSLESVEDIVSEKSLLLHKTPSQSFIIGPKALKDLYFKAQFIAFDESLDDLPHAEKIDSYDLKDLQYKLHFPDLSCFNLTWKAPFPDALSLINAGIKTAFLLKKKKEEILQGLNSYKPQLMQVEIGVTAQGVTFINHTYGKTADSIRNALEKLDIYAHGRKFMLLGCKVPADTVYKEKIKKAYSNESFEQILFFTEDNLKETFSDLNPLLKRGDTLLVQSETKIALENLLEYLGQSKEGNRLTVNLSNVFYNIQKLKGNSKVMAMVKANAYGTDSTLLSKYLYSCGVTLIGVAHPDEAITLKKNGIKQDIFVIHAGLDEINKIVDYDLEVAISSQEMVECLALVAEKKKKKIKVHLHIDTGMNRLGCRENQVLAIAKFISNSSSLIFEGVMTHFACADTLDENPFTFQQIERFKKSLTLLKDSNLYPKYIHASNSSAAMRQLLPDGNLVRIGLGMYGISEIGEQKLLDAITLTSKIVGINICMKGDTISYGRSFTVQRDLSKIAIVPLGYFDGLHRNFSGKSSFIVRGKKAPMVGTICMDFMMIDVTDIDEVKVGDGVLIFGKDAFGHENRIEDFANDVGTCTHELITCLGPRIQRLFIEN